MKKKKDPKKWIATIMESKDTLLTDIHFCIGMLTEIVKDIFRKHTDE